MSNSLSKIYSGELGVFEYDSKDWAVCELLGDSCLKYIGPTNVGIDIPVGLKSYKSLFSQVKFEKGAYIRSCSTLEVEDMTMMFYEAFLPEGFTLGDNFNTSNVKSMHGMFHYTKLPLGFTLGNHFNTINVKDMSRMFNNTILPEGFTLGGNFNTFNVNNMDSMFKDTKLPEGFTLGPSFITSNVEFMGCMFSNTELPDSFSLGDNFNTEKCKDMSSMFALVKMPKNFSLGSYFDTSSVSDMSYMFGKAFFSQNFSLGEKFNTNSVNCMKSMFKDASLNLNFKLTSKFSIKGIDFHEKYNPCIYSYMFEGCKVLDKMNSLLSKHSGFSQSSDLDEVVEYFKYGLGSELVKSKDDYSKNAIQKMIKEIKKMDNKGKHKEVLYSIALLSECLKDIDLLKSLSDISNPLLLVEGVCLSNPKSPIVIAFIKNKIYPEIRSLLSTDSGESKYNISDASSLLYKKYDKSLVNAAIIEYLSEHHLVL